MKKIVLFVSLFYFVCGIAQEKVVNKNGKEITVQNPLTNPVTGTGTVNFLSKFNGTSTLTNSQLFDNGTNVGIGTTTPSAKFEISSGTAGVSGLKFSNLTNANVGLSTYNKILGLNSAGEVGPALLSGSSLSGFTSGQVTFGNDSGELAQSSNLFWDQTNSRLGLGITNPNSKFEVINSGFFNGTENATHGIQISSGKTSTDYTLYMGTDKTNGVSYLQSVKWSIGMASLALNARGGNVGIGTATPAYKLHVIGNARFQYNTTNLGSGGDAAWAEFYGKTADANAQVGGLKLGWYNSFGGIDVIRPGGAVGLGLAFNYAETTAGTTNEGFRLTNVGNVGIGTTAPLQKFVVKGVNAQPASTGSASNAILRIEGETNHSLDIGTLANSPYGTYLQSTDKTNLANSLPLALNPVGGRVGIGTSNPTSTLEVNGAATNTTAFNAGAGTTIDFSKSNLAYTTASAGAFTLNNLKDGGTYTLAVQGATSGTSTFNASGFTFKSPNNGVTTASKHTLYTFIVMGTTVYFYMTKDL